VVDTAVATACGTTFRTDNTQIPPKPVVMWASEAEFKAVFTKLANAPLCNGPAD